MSGKGIFPEFKLTTKETHGFCCCNTSQTEAFIVIAITAVITGILWRSTVVAPIKLVAVFLHEFSHALAAWLTCGKVVGMEVNENFGGLTRTAGGTRWVTLSAGYIGSVIWGSFFIIMTYDKLPTRIAAGVFIASCVITALVLHVKNATLCGMKCCMGVTLRLVVVLVGAIPAGLWALEDNVQMSVHPLRWCMLAFGTICLLHALYDCVHDVLCQTINNRVQGKSDAVMFAEEICGTPRCWGLLWSMIAIFAALVALYGITVLSSNCRPF